MKIRRESPIINNLIHDKEGVRSTFLAMMNLLSCEIMEYFEIGSFPIHVTIEAMQDIIDLKFVATATDEVEK